MLGICAVSVLASSSARADVPDTRLTWNWDGFLDDVHNPAVALLAKHMKETALLQKWEDRAESTGWFGLGPHVSLVARDWDGARLLLGDMGVSDYVRLSRSTRMILTRIRLGSGRIAPFAQVGIGEWRADPDLVPFLSHDSKVATQVGGGLQFRAFSRWTFAVELDETLVMREMWEPEHARHTHRWNSFLGMRASF